MRQAAFLTVFLLGTGALGAQTIWAPKGTPAQYTAPHKPHTKLTDIRNKHAGKQDWRELIVDDEHLRSEYVSARPGTKMPRMIRPDTRTWWVVMDGQVRFEIEGADSFIASKGSMVQVPMQTIFSYEVTGDRPALLFETNIAGAKTLYVSDAKPDRKIPGFDWLPVNFQRLSGVYLHNNKPHTTFDEVAKGLDEGRLKGTIRIVQDDRGTANFIYGHEKNLPPLDPKQRGHYHPEGAEYWLIMKGQIRYPIEKVGVVIASEGDVVYVPKYTFHAPRWHGPGPSCRLAMNGFPNISHLFDAH